MADLKETWVAREDGQARRSGRPCRVGVPAMLPAYALIEGLEGSGQVELAFDTPARVADQLGAGEVEAALLSSIELQRFGDELTVIPAGCIAAAGPTLLVRVFSRVPAEEVSILWADVACATCAALFEVLWSVNYAAHPCMLPFDPTRAWTPDDAEAVLLVGNKVVADPPIGFDWQWDLGAMWFEMTGLPFVFAVWASTEPTCCAELFGPLEAARRRGCQLLPQIAARRSEQLGWPEDLAVRCLAEQTQFELTAAGREGLEDFFDYAVECDIIETLRPLRYFQA